MHLIFFPFGNKKSPLMKTELLNLKENSFYNIYIKQKCTVYIKIYCNDTFNYHKHLCLMIILDNLCILDFIFQIFKLLPKFYCNKTCEIGLLVVIFIMLTKKQTFSTFYLWGRGGKYIRMYQFND